MLVAANVSVFGAASLPAPPVPLSGIAIDGFFGSLLAIVSVALVGVVEFGMNDTVSTSGTCGGTGLLTPLTANGIPTAAPLIVALKVSGPVPRF